MSDDTPIYLEAEPETTVVWEFSHVDSGGVGGFSFGGFSTDFSGGGTGGGGGGGGVAVVDSGTGEVVARAYVNPESGTYEYVDPETTVVEESSGSTDTSVGSGGTVGGGTEGQGEPPASGSVETGIPDSTGGIPGVASPDSFNFRPTAGNWQETTCVSVNFGYGTPFLPMTVVRVGVIVGAPIVLSNGRTLSVREAQLDAANAAQAAGGIIVRMLDEGSIVPSEIQPRFVGFMGGAIETTGLGYRVRGCRPG
jgi:hypothetical protein